MFPKGVPGGTNSITDWAFKPRVVDVHCLDVGTKVLFGLGHLGAVSALELVGRQRDNFAENDGVQIF